MMADRILERGLDEVLRQLPKEDTPHYFVERFIDHDF